MKAEKTVVSDTHRHALKVEGMLDDLIRHLRSDVNRLDDRGGRVLFEASAEVLLGMKTAFKHFQKQSEPAMR